MLGLALLAMLILGVVLVLLNVPGLSKPLTERLRLDLRITQADGTVWAFDNIAIRANGLSNGSPEGPCAEPTDWFVDLFASAQRNPEGRSGELWVALGEIDGIPYLFSVTFQARGGGPPSTTTWRAESGPDAAPGAGQAVLRRSGPFWRFDVAAEAAMELQTQDGSAATAEYALRGRTPATYSTGGVIVFEAFCGLR